MKFWSISDLHIEDASDPLYRDLLFFIKNQVHSGDTLVLGGDVFELWVGSSNYFFEAYLELFLLLKAKGADGVKTFYIEGNHDFHLGGRFSEIQNMNVVPDSIEIKLGDKKFFVAHGDLVDSKDWSYRALRKAFRSLPIKAVAKAMSGKLIEKIGNKASEFSQKKRGGPANRVAPIERLSRLRKVFRNFAALKIQEGFDFVVLGHCHDLDEMMFKVNEREGHYMNMGFPRVHRSIVSWTPGESRLSRQSLDSLPK